jgi:hypothetical protein
MIVLVLVLVPSIAIADSGGDMEPWQQYGPAGGALAFVLAAGAWIKKRLDGGALHFSLTSKKAKVLTEENDDLRRENVHLESELSEIKRELDEAKQRLQDQLVKAEEREARLFERLITQADRSTDNDPSS